MNGRYTLYFALLPLSVVSSFVTLNLSFLLLPRSWQRLPLVCTLKAQRLWKVLMTSLTNDL